MLLGVYLGNEIDYLELVSSITVERAENTGDLLPKQHQCHSVVSELLPPRELGRIVCSES